MRLVPLSCRPSFLASAFAATLLGGLLAASLGAQTVAPSPAATASGFAAQITGQVETDGLAVPGVTVTITDPQTGQRYVTSTDESGRFTARVAHAGVFDIQASMVAFAPASAKLDVPASGAATAPVQLNLVLAAADTAPVATAQATAPVVPAAKAAGATATPGARTPPSAAARTASRSAERGGGRSGRGAGGARAAQDDNSFQQLDLSQTGDVQGNADAGAADSGIAGMNSSAATDSAVVVGEASQDERPMNGMAIQRMLAQNGGAPSLGGGQGGPGGAGGRGGFGGGGGRGGFGGGGGRGGFGGGRGGGGGFNFRQFQNRFNQPHGSVNYNLSDSALNALPDSINGTSATQQPPNAADQGYSATLTTPFVIPHLYNDHGKTNLTISFSGSHNSNLSQVNALVPTLAERQGDFSGVTNRNGTPVAVVNPQTGQPFNPALPNTIPTADISSAASALLAFIPLPTPGAAGNFNYSNTLNSLSTSHRVSVRLNHSFGAAQQGGGRRNRRGRSLNFSLNYAGGRNNQPGLFFPFIAGVSTTRGINAQLGYTQPLAGWINRLSLSFNRNRVDASNLYANNRNVAAQAGILGVSQDPNAWGVPTIQFATSGLHALQDTAPNFVRSQTWSLSDSMIRRVARHNVRFGGDVRWLQNNPDTDPSPRGVFSFDGQYSGFDFADFLLGLPQQTSERFGGGVFYFRQFEPDLYFNDNWQALGSFTLNYGLRWEYISPYTERGNRLTNLLVGPGFSTLTPAVAGQNGVPNSVIHPEYGHFRPTLGFAWRSWDNMIVTGGVGMAYNTGTYAGMATALAYQSPFITNQVNLGTAAAPLSLANGFTGANASINTFGVNPEYQAGYSYLWNLDIQRQLGRAYVINLDYSGSRGEHLDQLLAPNRTATGLLYPNLPPFLYDTTGGNSLYNGGSLIVSRRMSQSVSFRVRYTWSKMMDDASQIGGGGGAGGSIAQNPQDLDAEWALSSGNQTQHLNASYEWQLPYGLNHRWGDRTSFWSSMLGDWQFSGALDLATGSPLTPTVSNIFSNAQGLQALGVNVPLRADVTGTAIAAAQPTLTGFFNPAAFTEPAAGSYGNAGRNIIIGPGEITLNTALSKSFRMGEFRSLELRFTGNNVLNHPNWNSVDTNLNSLTFGNVTSFGNMRKISFSARFRF